MMLALSLAKDLALPIAIAVGALMGYWLRGLSQSATITDLQQMEGRIIGSINDSRLQPLTEKLLASESELKKRVTIVLLLLSVAFLSGCSQCRVVERYNESYARGVIYRCPDGVWVKNHDRISGERQWYRAMD